MVIPAAAGNRRSAGLFGDLLHAYNRIISMLIRGEQP